MHLLPDYISKEKVVKSNLLAELLINQIESRMLMPDENVIVSKYY